MNLLQKGITVILCCYNHSEFLTKQLEQILLQIDEIFSVILLDDGSTDNSYEIMSDFAKYSEKIFLVRNKKNEGLVKSVNRACKFIKSKHVYFASADDQIMPYFFRDFNKVINTYGNSGFYFGDIAEINADGQIIRRMKQLNFNETKKLSPEELAFQMSNGFRNAPGQTVIFDAYELERIGYFDENLGGWLDIYPQYIIGFRKGAVYLPGIYSIARITDNSWGKVQSSNIDLLRSAGVAITMKMMSEPALASYIKKSGVLAYALSSYKILIREKKLNQYLGFAKVLTIMYRELWYIIPQKFRIIIVGLIRKK